MKLGEEHIGEYGEVREENREMDTIIFHCVFAGNSQEFRKINNPIKVNC